MSTTVNTRGVLISAGAGLLLSLLATACGSDGKEKTGQSEPDAGLANPAAVYCIEQGGRLEPREGDGGTVTYCILPDGTEKEEWVYWRENHPTGP